MTILQRPDALSFSMNLKPFKINTPVDVSFSLVHDGVTLLTDSLSPDASDMVEISLRDVIHDRLSCSLPTSSEPYVQTAVAADFTAVIGSQSVSFRVIRGGIDRPSDTVENFLRANFLTWQPTVKPVTYSSPEYLSYYPVDSGCTVRVKAYFTDSSGSVASTAEKTLCSLTRGVVTTFSVQYAVIAGLFSGRLPAYYDVWVASSSDALTYTQRYYADVSRSEAEQWIFFENSLGGIDTFRAYGTVSLEAGHVHNIAEIDDVAYEYRVDTERKFTVNTGFLDVRERRWLLDFFPSAGKYVYAGSLVRRIVVVDDRVEYSLQELPSSFSFTFRIADALPLLNLPRHDLPVEMLGLTVPDVGSFTLPPRLLEFPRQPLSEGVLFPVQEPYSEEWAVTTLGGIAEYVKGKIDIPAPGMNRADLFGILGGKPRAGERINPEFIDLSEYLTGSALGHYATLADLVGAFEGKLDTQFFASVFTVYDEDGNPIVPNTYEQVAENLQVMVGAWTERYLSALGKNPDEEEGGGGVSGIDPVEMWKLLGGTYQTNEVIGVSHIPGLPADKITSGIFSIDRIPNIPLAKIPDLQKTLQQLRSDVNAKLDTRFFASVFTVYDEDGNPIVPNTYEQAAANLRLMVGAWTESYLSALGKNDDGTGGGDGGIADKDDVLAILGEFTSQEVFDNTDFATRTWVNANFPVNKKSTLEKITDGKIDDWDATTAWYKSIIGDDADDVINKWNEIITFLEGISDQSSLAEILAAKANSSVKITAGDGLTGGGDLSANRTLSVKIAQDGGLSADSEGLKISAGLVTSVTKPTGTEGLLYVNYLNGDTDCIDFTREIRWTDILDKPTDIEEYGIAAELGEKFVTIDTVQTVTAAKTFSALATFTNGVKIGEATLTWDSTNRMLKINEGLYSEKAISALGANGEQGGGGGGDVSYIQFDSSVTYALDRDYAATGARVKLPAYPVTSVNISGSAGNGKAVTAVTHVNGQLKFTIAELPALTAATNSKLGGIMTGFTTQPIARNYKVELDSNHNAFVNVPWTDTTYTFAEGTTNGTFKVTPSTASSATEIKVGGLKALAFKDNIAWSEITSGKPSLVTGVRRQSEGLLELTYENKTEYIDCTREVRWTDITGKPVDLEEYGLLSEMNEKYVTVEWFKKLFRVHVGKDTDGSKVVEPNAEINGSDYTIEGLFGVWTQQFLSVLGANSEAGGGSGVVDEGQVWLYLADDDASLAGHEKIAKSHLSLLENLTWSYGSVTTATGSSYNGQEARNVVIPKSLSHLTNDINAAALEELNAGSVTEKRFVTPSVLKQWLDGKSFGTVKKIKVGTGSEKTPDANGVVTLDAYPTLKGLIGSTAIGADNKPIYWDGNAFKTGIQLKALAYKENLAASDIPNISWNKITSDKPTTLSGYGITDAKISGGTITLGNVTITPVTSIVRESEGILKFIKGTETTYIDFTHEVRWRDVTDKPIDLEEYGILDELKEKFVTVEFFNRLFQAYKSTDTSDANKVSPNDTASIITNLKLMVGAWTEQYLSVLGKNTDTGGGSVVDEEQVWGYLASSDASKKIHSSHIDYEVSGNGNALTGISVSNGGKLSFSKEYFVKTVNRNNPDGANVVTDVSYNNAGTLTVTRSKVAFLDYVTKAEDETISGKKTFSAQQAFTAVQGTSPFTVTSNTLVANLNADMLDGVHKGGLLTGLENNGNAIKLTVGGTEKTLTVGYASDAGKLNGEAASYYAKASSLEDATNDIDTLKGYFTGNVANVAEKLNTATTYSAWGQTYWQNGVPNSVSGNMSGVERITFNKAASDRQLSISKGGMVNFNAASAGGWAWGLASRSNDSSAEIGMIGFLGDGDAVDYAFVGGTYNSPHLVVLGNKVSGKGGYVGIGTTSPVMTLHVEGTLGVTETTTLVGLLTANGGIAIPAGKTLKIGTIVLQDDNGLLKVWDGAGNVVKGIYATGTVSALGANSESGGGGFDQQGLWEELGSSPWTNKQISKAHLTTALGQYFNKVTLGGTDYTVNNGTVTLPVTSYNAQLEANNLTAVAKVGGTEIKVKMPNVATTTYSFSTGDNNGQIKVTPTTDGTPGTAVNVSVKGLAAAAYKAVSTSISGSDNLPTDKAVKTFVEGKGYISSLSFTKENDGILKVTAGSVTNVIDMTRTVRWRDVTEKPTDLEEYGIASEVVTIAGAQTITGVKTFSNGLTAAGVNAGFIEMKPTGRTGDGGYIDFHYNNSDADYTSRIIEDSSRHLHIYADNGVYISGYITSGNEVTASSDERLKNIAGDIRLSVKGIAAAPSVYFYWKVGRDKKKHIGSLAQYWEKVLPEAVSHDGQDYMSLNYQSVSLAAAIAIARETLRIGDDVSRLKRRVEELEAEVGRLRAA